MSRGMPGLLAKFLARDAFKTVVVTLIVPSAALQAFGVLTHDVQLLRAMPKEPLQCGAAHAPSVHALSRARPGGLARDPRCRLGPMGSCRLRRYSCDWQRQNWGEGQWRRCLKRCASPLSVDGMHAATANVTVRAHRGFIVSHVSAAFLCVKKSD